MMIHYGDLIVVPKGSLVFDIVIEVPKTINDISVHVNICCVTKRDESMIYVGQNFYTNYYCVIFDGRALFVDSSVIQKCCVIQCIKDLIHV